MEQVLEPEAFRTSSARATRDDASTVRPGPLASERDAERLRRAVTDALHDAVREVVVDLAGASSISDEAIAILLVLHAGADRYRSTVRIAHANHSIGRKLRTTGAMRHLT